MERDAIRSVKPDAFVTTNLMGTFKGLDYFKWAKEMDVVSWDNYPSYDTPWSSIAMTHDLMRRFGKNQPFYADGADAKPLAEMINPRADAFLRAPVNCRVLSNGAK